MAMWLRQSTASQEILLGPFVDSTDGDTAETALSIANTDIKLWVEGATTEANKTSGGATHIAGGRYSAVLDATDTATLGKLEINVKVAGALAVRREFMVVPAMVYDSLILGSDVLQADVTQFNGTAGTFAAGRPEVNTTHAAGTAWGSGAITSGSVAASALNGKGDWNVGKTGYALTQTFPTNFSSMVISASGIVDSNVAQILGTGASTATIRANVISYGGSAGTFSGGRPEVSLGNVAHGGAAATMQLGGAGGLTATHTGNTTGSVGSVTGAVGSVTGAVGSVTAAVTLPTIPANWITAAGTAVDFGTEIAAAVWGESLPGSYTSGQAGFKLNAAGSAADPWSTSLPGAYSAGSAGHIIGNRIDAAITSRLAPTVASRTLDVTATGAAGIDWANVEGQGTTVALTNTSSNAYLASGEAAIVAGNVWTNATRTLSAGTNIVLAKGTGVTGFTDLDAAGVRMAVGLASANLDTQLTAIDDFLDTEVAAIKAKTDQMVFTTANRLDSTVIDKTGFSLAAAGLDSVAIETGLNARQALSLTTAASVGRLSGAATTTVTILGAGVATTRAVATVDADGNRTAITLTPPA
jgi:hypothetical protein